MASIRRVSPKRFSGTALVPAALPSSSRVSQCTKCGTLTMLPRCPNCEMPTFAPGPAAQATAGQPTPIGVRPGLPSPVATQAQTPGQRSASVGPQWHVAPAVGPRTPMSPAPQVVPAAPSAETAVLRGAVEKLSTDLAERQRELEAIKSEATSTVLSKHELQELWRTLRRQNEDLEKSHLLEAELRSLQQKYESLSIERERLVREATSRLDQGVAIDKLTDELRRTQLRALEAEGEAETFKRTAKEAESALNAQKEKVQRATHEVLELQRIVSESRHEDKQEVQRLREAVARREAENSALELRHDELQQDYEKVVRKKASESREVHERLRSLQLQLDTAEAEAKAAREESKSLSARLRQALEETNAARQALHLIDARETAKTERLQGELDETESLRFSLKELQSQHASLERQGSDARKENAALKAALSQATAARDEVAADLRKAEGHRKHQQRQIDELRLELRRLDYEAESHVQRERKLEESEKWTGFDASSRVADSQRDVIVARETVAKQQREIDELNERLTQSQIELTQQKAEAERLRGTSETTAVQRQQEIRDAAEAEKALLRQHMCDLRNQLREKEVQAERKEEAHNQFVIALQKELADAKSRTDELGFEVQRMRAFSPEKSKHREEELQNHVKRERTRCEDVEKRLDDHKALLETIQGELATSRKETAEVSASFRKAENVLRTLRETLRCSSDDQLPQVAARVVSERDSVSTELRRMQESMSQFVSETDSTLKRVVEEKDTLQRELDALRAAKRVDEKELTSLRAEIDTKIEKGLQAMRKECDNLGRDLETARVAAHSSELRRAHDIDAVRAELREKENRCSQLVTEKDSIYQAHVQLLKDAEQAKKTAQQHYATASELRSEVTAQNATITSLSGQLRDLQRTVERLQQDKQRLAADAANAKSAADGEVTEATLRLDELRDKYTKETETLRATVRVEREKVLREVEASHAAQLRVSELELEVDSLKADKERLVKDVDLSRRSQITKSESFHTLADEMNREKENMRREISDLRNKCSELVKECDSTTREKCHVEELAEQNAKQRDMALRQLDAAKMERDVAMRAAFDLKQEQVGQKHSPSPHTSQVLSQPTASSNVGPMPRHWPPVPVTGASSTPTVGGLSLGPTSLSERPHSAAKAKNDALFQHFRAQQHGQSTPSAVDERSRHLPSAEPLPLGAYRSTVR